MGTLKKDELRKKKADRGLPALPGLRLEVDSVNVLSQPVTAEDAVRYVASLREELYAWEQALQLRMNPVPKLGDDPVLVIQKITAAVCGVDTFEMYMSDRGNENLVWARQLAMFISYVDYELGSTTTLALRFRRLDHGTISYAKKVVAARISPGDFGDRFKTQYQLCLRRVAEFLPIKVATQEASR